MDRACHRFLFHRPAFVFRDPEASVISFEEGSAQIYFSNVNDWLISLDRSPFGNFVTDRLVSRQDVVACLRKVTAWSTDHGIKSIIVRSFPEAYNPQIAAVTKAALVESLFQIQFEDVAQLISTTSSAGLQLNVHKKRRLRNAQKEGFEFRALAPTSLEDAYSLIVQSRENKGYPLTMSLKALAEMFNLFGKEYLLFGVFDKDLMIASSVCIKVSEEIFYCFYIGDHLRYRAHSPVTRLIAGIYDYCKQQNFSILDLGLSSDHGLVNKGLYNFKKSFGTFDSPKLTFIKKL